MDIRTYGRALAKMRCPFVRFASRYDTRRAKRLEAVLGGRRRTIRPEERGTAEAKPVPLKEAAILM